MAEENVSEEPAAPSQPLLADIVLKQKKLFDNPQHLPTFEEVKHFVKLYNRYARDSKNDAERRELVNNLQAFIQHPKASRALRIAECPEPPTPPLAIARGNDSVTVVWNPVTDASEHKDHESLHYQLSWGFQFMGVWKHQMVYSGARMNVRGLEAGQTYAFKVRAKNPKGWSKYSAIALISTAKKVDHSAERAAHADGNPDSPKKGIWHMFKQIPALRRAIAEGYEQLVCSIIRPPRTRYDMADLGGMTFRIGKRVFQRTDFHLTSTRGLRLCCSHWEPLEQQRQAPTLPVVIHLHGNCGCRVDAIDFLEEALSNGMTVVGIDLSGSGLSEGEYISLGWHEHHETHTLVQHLLRHRRVSTVHLWGRSMGAVTALMYAIAHPKAVRAMVLDSPFQDFWVLAMELVSKIDFKIPGFAVGLVKMFIRNSTKSRANVDMDKLSPISGIHTCSTPALFGVGSHDAFVPPHHTKALYAKHGGVKQLAIFPGDHNSMRPKRFIDAAAKFLATASPQVTLGSFAPANNPDVASDSAAAAGAAASTSSSYA